MGFQTLINQGLAMSAGLKSIDTKKDMSSITSEINEMKANMANIQAEQMKIARQKMRQTRYGYRKLSRQVDAIQKTLGGQLNVKQQ